ncbi:hypothetical protein C0030_002380 [Candidatus Liberibacter solanacearum]|uniref:Uncharacterized protein n=1 Tax=Candidatus Liberibacter solanacearum TaxID=556287 RepID=A0A3R7NJB3_9HYPH|nr:hypothetical protein [Candidatus Liberibacter solanacearum]RPD37383.1 hypothetical protein C0030_002380 [Candidatus Liberibacter solanacearum]
MGLELKHGDKENPLHKELDKEQIQQEKLYTKRIEDDNNMRTQFSDRAFKITTGWIIILALFIATQVINAPTCFVQLCEVKFSSIVVSMSSMALGYWYLVGKGLFD